MDQRIYRLGLVAVTVLLSLNSTVQLPRISMNWAVSAQTTQERKAEALRLNDIGIGQFNTGQLQEALQTFDQALSIFKAIGDREMKGTVLNNIGLVYRTLGQYPQALKYYEQALVIANEVGDKAGVGTTLGNIGEVYRNQGQYPQALKYYEQALSIAKDVGDKTGEGMVLNNIGTAYFNLGQYSQALQYYSLALIIDKKTGDKASEGITLGNIGGVYLNLGQYPQALKYSEQALVISKEAGNKVGVGNILKIIGNVYLNLGQHPQALQYYSLALIIDKKTGDKAGIGSTLNNIGLAYRNLGQYQEALKYYEQALVIRKEVGNNSGIGTTLDNIGNVYFALGQYADALKYSEQALVIERELGDNAGVGVTLSNIGNVYLALRQYIDAEKTLFSAIEVLESLRPGLTDASKIAIFETQAQTYRFLQQTLVAQNKTNHALLIAERGRARAFVELLASRQSSHSNIQLTIKSLDLQQIKQVAKTQNATIVEYSLIKNTFKNQGQEQWRESSLYIWVVKPTGEVAFKQVDLTSLKTPLEDLVISSRESIGVRGRGLAVEPRTDAPTPAKQLQQLDQLLIQPIAQFLPTNPQARVIFIPQSSLFLVPFSALQDEQGKYLIEKHTILTAPAIQVLELTHQQRQKQKLRAQNLTPLQGKDLLVMGNPTMPSILDKTGELHQLPSLPGAETEAKAIAQLFNTTAITGSFATKANILQQLASARIAHFATHGLLDDFKASGVPGAIALAPSGKDNGLLTASEIFDLKLNTELVVLSACDTGRGDIKGDGVVGLSRSLISAGVHSIIVSLWSIPDAPTAELMTEFYRQIQQNPDKATALRNAMLMTMKLHPNPRDWAAFILIGEAD